MKKMKLLVLCLACLGFSAHAEKTGYYVGFGVTKHSFAVTEDSSAGDSFEHAFDGEGKSMVELRAGKWFLNSGNFSVAGEMTLSSSTMSETKRVLGYEQMVEYKPRWTLLAKGQYNFTERFGAYGVAGFGYDSYDARYCSATGCASDSEDGFVSVIGLGVSYQPTESVELDLSIRARGGVEIKSDPYGTQRYGIGSLNLGVNYRF